MKDIFNNIIREGYVVAFNPPDYKGLVKGKVIGFSNKSVRVSYLHQGREQITTRFPNDVTVTSADLKECLAGFMALAQLNGAYLDPEMTVWVRERLAGKQRTPVQVWHDLIQ